jgi:hypothetical protein
MMASKESILKEKNVFPMIPTGVVSEIRLS